MKANASENPKQRLTNEEMMSQMATFLLAGKEIALCSRAGIDDCTWYRP